MRILSLYIDAFGGVKRRAYSFGEGIFEILDENGAGKSTLAAFIKAMLYGLDGTATRDLATNEFALYEPWGGGRFGGTLTFSTAEGCYRIERYFENKRGANKHTGEIRVIDTATELPTEAFGEEPGRALFGVDGESFLRTAYLSSRGKVAGKTEDISAKLGGLEGEEFDMKNAEAALHLIEKKRLEIRTRTKQKNGVKLLDIAERELADTERRITEATAAAEAEGRERAAMADTEKGLATLRGQLATLMAAKEATDRRLGEEKAKREQIDELSAEIEADRAALGRLRTGTPGTPPSAEMLAALTADLGEYNHLLSRKRELLPATDGIMPTEDEVGELHKLIKRRSEARERLSSLPAAEGEGQAARGHASSLLILLSALLLILGAVLLSPSPAAGGILLSGGAISAGLFLLLLFRTRAERTHTAERFEAARLLRAEAERACREAEGALKERLAALSLPIDTDESKIRELHSRVLAAQLASEEEKRITARADALKERLEGALAGYPTLHPTEDIGVRIRALRELCRTLAEGEAALAAKQERRSRLLPAIEASPQAELLENAKSIHEMIGRIKAEIEQKAAGAAAARERADGYRTLADALDELFDLRDVKRAEVERLSRRLATLDRTAALLNEAREALEARYLGGIRKRITAYTDRLLGARLGEVRLSTELSLAFAEGGEGHSATYYSTGLHAISDICLRLALTDELYPSDPPPLILDDPFLSLDEKNLAAARLLLHELAPTRQIIYLTCHEARSMK